MGLNIYGTRKTTDEVIRDLGYKVLQVGSSDTSNAVGLLGNFLLEDARLIFKRRRFLWPQCIAIFFEECPYGSAMWANRKKFLPECEEIARALKEDRDLKVTVAVREIF